jgi:ABC-type transport system involved in cytochrome c biogenesis permease subunit
MLGKITILCFAASYGVALALEVTRLFFRSGVRGLVMLGFAAAGLLAHTLYLLHHWTSLGRTPLSSEFDWTLVAAWLLVVAYLYLTYYHPRNPIGVFLLPLVLGLVVWSQWVSDAPFSKEQGTRLLGTTHGVCLLLGTVAVFLGFVSGVMYLLQAYRLKHKQLWGGVQLPSLEWLQKMAGRAILISLVMLLGGFITGLLLSQRKHGTIRFAEPVVWSSSALVAWLLIEAAFNALYKPSRVGRKVAYLTVANFLFLLLALGSLFFDTLHGAADDAPAPRNEEAAVGSLHRDMGSGEAPA